MHFPINQVTNNQPTKKGQSLIELILVFALAAILLPALYVGLFSATEGRVQQDKRLDAIALLKEAQEAARTVRETGWTTFAVNGTYHPVVSGNNWILSAGTQTVNGFSRSIIVSDTQRDGAGNIVNSDGTVDPSTKKVVSTVAWTDPFVSQVTATQYLTRYLDNLTYSQTTQAEFDTGTKYNTVSTNTAGGEIILSDNNKAKWCSPSFSSSTIDLPDGPPVAVAARSNVGSTGVPNDVLTATAPTTASSVKLAHINVTANTDPPVSTLRGTFTLDPTKYSAPGLVPTGIGLDNNFKTNDVAYYTSSSNKLYALLGTDLPDKEVVAILVNDGDDFSSSEYQDSVNKIYKYWTYFNTTRYSTTDTGMRDPTANAADSGGDANGYDSNPTRAYTDNASYAVDTNSGSGTGTNCTGADKDKHRYYNYGITVPGGTTIHGIEVRLDARVDSTSGSPQICVQLSWNGGTTWTTAKTTTTLGTSEATYVLGGATDTWGRTWSDTNFTNANFRVRVINVASNTSRDFSLDYAGVKVYHASGSASNDQAPFGYGGVALTVHENKGYVASGGYLYTMDLSNIDGKSATNGLDMVGCRIELDGYDCQPGNGLDRKYSSGESGATWSDTTTPVHPDTCADGGNIELYGTNDIYPVSVSGSTYIYAAVGAGTNPEFNIANVSSVPTTTSTPSISNNSCGRSSGGNAGWKKVGSYDFNTASGTEEAANSVFAKSDGTRAYISSNGGADSKQFYILNTTSKTAPAFLSGPNNGTGPTSGYYNSTGANGELYPRRSMTVLNGQRVVLVGRDGVTGGGDTEEYQVLDSTNEATPAYCSGVNFDAGFNDLTSVSEADLDTFVYMVANTNLNELKIIQGGPDGRYNESGTLESATFDAGYSTAFNRFTATSVMPAQTTAQYQIAGADPVGGSCTGAMYTYIGPDGTAGSYYSSAGGTIYLNDDGGGYENPARCFRYKVFLSTTDFNATPVFNDILVNYSP